MPAVSAVLGALVALFVCRLVVTIVAIPPWQNPDEPAHFTRVRQFARAMSGQRTSQPDADRDVVESMARYRWWEYYERQTPAELPLSPGLIVSDVGGPAAYYAALGWVMGLARIDGLLPAFYGLRVVSALFSMLALWCAWRGARYVFRENEALLVPGVLSLHPQFVIVSTSVGPDSVLSFLGALLWWQAMRLVETPAALGSLFTLWTVGLVAPFVRRSGTPLVAMAFMAWLFSFTRALRLGWRQIARLAVAMVAVIAVAGGVMVLAEAEVARLVAYTVPILERIVGAESDWAFFKAFSVALFDNSWLLVGWAQYRPPTEWLVAVRLLTLAVAVGIVFACWRRSGLASKPRLFLVTLVFVLIQIAAEYAWHFRLVTGPQGRYLFPAIVPFTALFCTGWLALWPDRARRASAVTLLAVLGVLDAIAWTAVIIPVYVP